MLKKNPNASSSCRWFAATLAVACLIHPAQAQSQFKPHSLPPTPAFTQLFDSTGHAKAHGARVTVRYPAGWTAQEGGRPRVVQSFVDTRNLSPLTFSLALEADTEDVEGSCAETPAETWRKITAVQGITVNQVTLLRYQGKPGAILELTQQMPYGGATYYAQSTMMSVCHQRYLVKVTCAIGGASPQAASAAMQQAALLCRDYFKSLTLNS